MEELTKNEKPTPNASYNKWGLLIVLMSMVHILDEFVSNIGGVIAVVVADTYFPGLAPVEGILEVGQRSAILIVVSILGFLPKSMADKFGRKKTLIIGVFGMTLGFLLIAFSGTNFIIYLIGSAFTGFFLSADIQLIFINEESPEEKRGRIAGFVYLLGTVGTLFVVGLRFIFVTDDPQALPQLEGLPSYLQDWHALYLIPGILGLVVSLIMILFLKESRVYLEAKKTDHLKLKSGKSTNIITSTVDLFKDKKLRKTFAWRLLAVAIFTISISAYQTFGGGFMSETGQFTETDKSWINLVKTLVVIGFYFLFGQIMDRIGRKTALIGLQIIFLVGILTYVFSVINHSIIGTGLGWGFAFTGTWVFANYHYVSLNEVMPTKFRGTSMALMFLVNLVIMGLLKLVIYPEMNKNLLIFSTNIPLYYYICLPFTVLLIYLIWSNFKETKGIDLTTVE